MCIVKTPKIDPATSKVKDPAIIRNPYLDGVDPVTKALRSGRSSLRIERGSPPRGTTPAPTPADTSGTVGTPTVPVGGGAGTPGALRRAFGGR